MPATVEKLGEAADRLASATHKALAFAATINRDHRAGYEHEPDLADAERVAGAVIDHANQVANLVWEIAHQGVTDG